ncbi:hypothetical protein [Nocardia sp. NPDC050710]|uniref:hypothetical protein n=1 Tax=Nocardia sp. NPDC050710 TaxID=3157220 RepID=UPI0033E2B08A
MAALADYLPTTIGKTRMRPDLDRYIPIVRLDPRYQPYLSADTQPTKRVLDVGHHAAFAVPPGPGTAIAEFPGIVTRAVRLPVMALVRVEHTTQVVAVHGDGIHRIRRDTDTFGGSPTGISWHLAELDSRWVIAVHDQDPHVGRCWAS